MSRLLIAIVALAIAAGCNQGDDRLAEKARIEGAAAAKAELQAQLDAKDQLIEKARNEGKAAAKAELEAQMENIDLLIQKARAEGRAQAEAELVAQNDNLAAKAQEMEVDLATRHLFYQALRGTYEGSLVTERAEFKVRVSLVPSLPPYTSARVRQLDEIASDLNNLSLNAQIVQWNPVNTLSAVGCRIEGLRPDMLKGELSIASSNCPNLYRLRLFDTEIFEAMTALNGEAPKDPEQSREVATAVREGKLASISEIRGEVHPSTNAAIYSLTAKRTLR